MTSNRWLLVCAVGMAVASVWPVAAEVGGVIGPDAPKPNILFILLDDFGWAEIGRNRPPTKDVKTPNMDALVSSGVFLDRLYAHKFCSPTRCAIQSGRRPAHVNTINAFIDTFNPDDPIGGAAGIPRNMTTIAAKLKKAGYLTHYVGKQDFGMATPDRTPQGRGYDTALGYFSHANDYYSYTFSSCPNPNNGNQSTPITDLWQEDQPALGLHNCPECTFTTQNASCGRCINEDTLFTQHVVSKIKTHNHSHPLFLFWAPHTVHGPLQPPVAYQEEFSFIDFKGRRNYHALVTFIDAYIGQVVQTLKDEGLFDNTLIILQSDNGGPINGGSNNYPLRGGKFSLWEGGQRVVGAVAGGFLPESQRGTSRTDLVASWDWYSTFCNLAGVDPADPVAAAAGLPAPDSINVWDYISGASNKSERTRLVMSSNQGGDHNRTRGETVIGGIIRPPYKLVIGYGPKDTLDFATWTSLDSPNSTLPNLGSFTQVCGHTPETGCLYDVWADPAEYVNLATQMPDVWKSLYMEAQQANQTVYSPYRGEASPLACEYALGLYNGTWGPFADV